MSEPLRATIHGRHAVEQLLHMVARHYGAGLLTEPSVSPAPHLGVCAVRIVLEYYGPMPGLPGLVPDPADEVDTVSG